MEKFAVDLEKVLNDFEYSEEQLHDYSPEQRNIGNAYSCNYSDYPEHCRRPPASNYRRPPFEPVILADADFSVSAGRPSSQDYSSSSNYSDSSNNESTVVTSDDSLPNNTSDNHRSIFSFKNKDFKPDLIESNSDTCSSVKELDRFERHLPDIASADVDIKDEKVNFDLINNSITPIINSSVAESKPQDVVRFPSASELSENELRLYLEELEEREFSDSDMVSKINVSASEIHSDSNYSAYSSKETKEIIKSEKYKCVDESDVEVEENNTSTPLNDTERVAEDSEKFFSNSNNHDSMTQSGTSDSFSMEEEVTKNSLLESTFNTDEVSVVNDFVNDKLSEKEKNIISETDVTDGCVNKNADVSKSETVMSETGTSDDHNSGEHDGCESVEMLYPPTVSSDDSQHINITVNQKFEEFSSDITIESNSKIKESDKIQIDNTYCLNIIDKDHVKSVQDRSVPISDNSYQVLDSKTAISTLEGTVEDEIRPGPSNSQENMNINTTDKMNTQPKLQRPDSLNLTHTTQTSDVSSTSADSGSLLSIEERKIGKEPPFWIPDSETAVCMHCQMKFTLVKRRHHCRACGLVLCSKCCGMKAGLEYLGYEEARVCHSCHSIIEKINSLSVKRPNPNNPMEYCSTIPPLLQVGPTQPNPPSVLVPVVGVLKREGRTKTNDIPKQVIFSDGIRPGGDLTELDVSSEPRLPLRRHTRITKRVGTPPGNVYSHRHILNPETHSFIPNNSDLPPVVNKIQGEYVYSELENPLIVGDKPVKFSINRNLFVIVNRIILDCCVNRDVWCMTTEGLSCVSQDEIVFLLEVLPDEKYPPKDIFWVVNMLFQEASKGSTVTEMSFASPHLNQLFDSKEHGGFVFIRPTYQCVQKLLLPPPPFLIAILIHKWEAPWARLFPIRLVLRLGAEYRYYPCPLVSVRNRPALFTDIGHTIISLLADFRKYSYSLPTVRGLLIHMEDRLTTILLPKNRYDQVVRAINNSEENVLAFAGNISMIADSHLVCIQSTQDDTSYHTQAININNKPRQVTGASFIVFNGSLKQCAWTGKSNIVEDGLMVQIPSESMTNLRAALRQMNDYSIGCGPQAEEVVLLKWVADDISFNVGVRSNIDNRELDGVPSIRVHNGTDYSGSLRLIRWTEVFILQSDEVAGNKTDDTINISKLSESIARATCIALVPFLDLLATANLTTIAVRATIHPENVGYEAGSRGERLPPLYMKSLDEALIPVVHEAAVSIRDISYPIVLELIFKVMEQ